MFYVRLNIILEISIDFIVLLEHNLEISLPRQYLGGKRCTKTTLNYKIEGSLSSKKKGMLFVFWTKTKNDLLAATYKSYLYKYVFPMTDKGHY